MKARGYQLHLLYQALFNLKIASKLSNFSSVFQCTI
jgi:hypothetical protein